MAGVLQDAGLPPRLWPGHGRQHGHLDLGGSAVCFLSPGCLAGPYVMLVLLGLTSCLSCTVFVLHCDSLCLVFHCLRSALCSTESMFYCLCSTVYVFYCLCSTESMFYCLCSTVYVFYSLCSTESMFYCLCSTVSMFFCRPSTVSMSCCLRSTMSVLHCVHVVLSTFCYVYAPLCPCRVVYVPLCLWSTVSMLYVSLCLCSSMFHCVYDSLCLCLNSCNNCVCVLLCSTVSMFYGLYPCSFVPLYLPSTVSMFQRINILLRLCSMCMCCIVFVFCMSILHRVY